MANEKARLTVAFTGEAAARVRRLARLNESHDPRETVGRACAVYDCLLRAVADDGAVPILRYPDGSEREIVLK